MKTIYSNFGNFIKIALGVIAFGALVSCGGGGGGGGSGSGLSIVPPVSTSGIVLQPEVNPIEGELRNILDTSSVADVHSNMFGREDLIFNNYDSAAHGEITVGMVLALGSTTEAPDGLFRVVESMTTDASGNLMVGTRQAAMGEIIRDGEFTISAVLSASGSGTTSVQSFNLLGGVAAEPLNVIQQVGGVSRLRDCPAGPSNYATPDAHLPFAGCSSFSFISAVVICVFRDGRYTTELRSSFRGQAAFGVASNSAGRVNQSITVAFDAIRYNIPTPQGLSIPIYLQPIFYAGVTGNSANDEDFSIGVRANISGNARTNIGDIVGAADIVSALSELAANVTPQITDIPLVGDISNITANFQVYARDVVRIRPFSVNAPGATEIGYQGTMAVTISNNVIIGEAAGMGVSRVSSPNSQNLFSDGTAATGNVTVTFGVSSPFRRFGGGSVGRGVAYGIDEISDDLWRIDASTGGATRVGPLGSNREIGAAFVLNGVAYGIDQTSDDLWRINTSTGGATRVGSLGSDRQIRAAFVLNGVAYGIDRNSGDLLRINTSTGGATRVGSLGFSRRNIHAAFVLNGVAYGIETLEILGGLWRIDTSTGQATRVGSLGSSRVITGAFVLNGVAYGI